MQPNIHVTVVSRGGGWKEYIRGNNDHNFFQNYKPADPGGSKIPSTRKMKETAPCTSLSNCLRTGDKETVLRVHRKKKVF